MRKPTGEDGSVRWAAFAPVLVLVCLVAGGTGPAPRGAEPTLLQGTPRTHALDPEAASYLSDRDDDGLPDYAFVIDWDDDGTLEMEDDLQAAIDALTDDGEKLVQIGPGAFEAPAVAQGLHGILELPSNLVLEGSGPGITILHGFDSTDLTSLQAVLTNDDHIGGNANIVVRGLEIDGGWGSEDASSMPQGQTRMGVFLNRCSDCRIEYIAVHDTLHSCLYSKNGSNLWLGGNTLTSCGNYTGGGPTYSCVYLYAGGGGTQSTVHVSDNSCSGTGAAGISLRRESAASTLTDIHITGNSISFARTDGVSTSPCMMLRGAENVYVTGHNLCHATGGVQTFDVDDYYDNAAGAVRNVLVEDLVVADSGPGAAGLRVADYVDTGTFRRIEVVGTAYPIQCMTITNPMRDVVFEDIRLVDCGGIGIFENTAHGSGAETDERLAFRRIEVESNGAGDGIYFQGPVREMTFEGVGVRGSPGNGVRFAEEVRATTVAGLDVENVSGHGILIAGGSVGLVIDEASIAGTGGHGVAFDAGDGPDQASLELRRSSLTEIGQRGIEVIVNGLGLDSMTAADNTFDGVAYEGIAVYSGAATSEAVTVTGNTLRDFGRLVPGSVDSRGVEVVGSVNALEVASNRLEDLADQAERGIFLDVDTATDPASLCTNRCTGTLDSLECIRVVGETAYETDSDTDDAVNACDCAPLDATTYPGAPETNDAADNQCPGDLGHGLIDEISGLCGFHDPVDRNEYSWPAQAGAVEYQAGRSGAPDFSAGCSSAVTGDTYWSDPAAPLSGELFFYLVRALAPNPGSWGPDSGGTERAVTCP